MAIDLPPDAAQQASAEISLLKSSMCRVIKGKDEVVDQVLICLLAGGHLLIEDLPGLGKTTLAYCLAKAIDCQFQRIQFTADLLPTDVLGVAIYDEAAKGFIFRQGPIFSNIVLADEINRSTPKTQSALLEAMDRAKVSVDGETHLIGRPFMVLATQNPVDYEGTFPLPDSQMDRFLIRLSMGYPQFTDELTILRNGYLHYDDIPIEPVLSGQTIEMLQSLVHKVYIEDSVLEYLLRCITATRETPALINGISTRGSLALKTAAQARALYQGRAFVTPQDVAALFYPVCGHRLACHGALPDTNDPGSHSAVQAILTGILASTPVPK
ncbi:MAG: MoxR family ATPase [Verrucomicrobia bacterium]|nr:MoxR family ATPase [Verrucomicrobiota bacterium]